MVKEHVQSQHTLNVTAVVQTIINGTVLVTRAKPSVPKVVQHQVVEADAAEAVVAVPKEVEVNPRIDHGGSLNLPTRRSHTRTLPPASLGGGANCVTKGRAHIASLMTRMVAFPAPSTTKIISLLNLQGLWLREPSWTSSQVGQQRQQSCLPRKLQD
jgi:hypothetical protein